MDRRITIKDVAKEAGVSFKTISNVINDTGSMRPETRRRVQAVIDRMGYHANNSARSLRTGTTGLIGLAVSPFDQPFSSYLASEVIESAREYGCGVVVDTYSADGAVDDVINDMSRLTVDGWIAFATAPLRPGSELLADPNSLVLVGDYLSHGKVDSVTMPNIVAVRQVTLALLRSGLRRIGLIGLPSWFGRPGGDWRAEQERLLAASQGAAELRARGFLEGHQELGIEPERQLMVPPERWTIPAGRVAVRQLLAAGPLPQAIICANDALAVGAIHGLQEQGIAVPEQVQVIGFDNIGEGEFINPALTTIDPDIEGYAQMAVAMLMERIGGYRGVPRSRTTDFTVVERESAHLPEVAGW